MRFCDRQEKTGSGIEMLDSPQGDVEALAVEEVVKRNRSGLNTEPGRTAQCTGCRKFRGAIRDGEENPPSS